MEEGIKSLVGGEMRRNGNHQFRVDDGKSREGQRTAEADFFLHFLVGDDTPRIGFRSGTGCGRDGNYWQSFGDGTSFSGTCRNVIPVIAFVASHDGNGLGRVDAAASS